MPELNPLSPILDDFLTGQCISEHHGVRCYPAVHKETEEKYIVKVISIPSSAKQLDVLLMTGAVRDQAEALAYFTTLAQDVQNEASTLNDLSLLEGFLPCQQVQCAVTEDQSGYEVYLLFPYRRTLDTVFRYEGMTHLAAVNMGMDLCAALAACRRAGWLYVDLKPENVHLNGKKGYCIGDLGFIPLNGLKYASLPDKYRGSYTAPEMADAMAEMSTTLDIYALGLILYQAYNGGVLPFNGTAPQEMPDPPLYADYEMAEIILRACCPDPTVRWQDPAQMGQALVSYMQRNEVNDVPIVPSVPEEDIEEESEEFLPDMTEDELSAALSEEDAELQQIAALAAEDNLLSEADLASLDADLAMEDASDMLAQADELIALVPPEPVVAPEAVDIPIPEPLIVAGQEEAVTSEATDDEILKAEEPAPVVQEPVEDPAAQPIAPPIEEAVAPPPPIKQQKKNVKHRKQPVKKVRHIGRWIALTICVLLLAFILSAGYYYYSNEYLQHIEALTVTGTDNSITVQIDSDIEDVLLSVVCTDSYGNTHPGKVNDGIAVFENLKPQTNYAVKVTIGGFHQLTGQTADSFTTASQTQILSFNSAIGSTDGSVILGFTASGPMPDSWNMVYEAEGEPAKTVNFTGTTVCIDSLTVGKQYTFTLQPSEDLYMAGQTQLKYTASNIVFAQDLTITECHDGFLNIQWTAPAGETVEFWTVHCYNASGYDETVVISDTGYSFRNVDNSTPCTVEVTAVGMTQSVSTTICANPITVWNMPVKIDGGQITLSWTFTGKAPEGGWRVVWTIDGCQQQAILCDSASVVIPCYVPGGHYTFTLEAADGTFIFGNKKETALPDAEVFNDGWLTAADIQTATCIAPQTEDVWTWQDIPNENFVSIFPAGSEAHLLLTTQGTISDTVNEIEVSYILRTTDGTFVSCITELHPWSTMWLEGGCLMKLPLLPEVPGAYLLEIYFNNAFVDSKPITIE